MRIEIEVSYLESDLADLIIKYHTEKFGNAPSGYEWKCAEKYGVYTVKAVEIIEEEPELKPNE
jgi:hypothetical protein